MWVLKFGGSSVRDAQRIRQVAELIAQQKQAAAPHRLAVVVSALGGTTDELLEIGRGAATSKKQAAARLAELMRRHCTEAEELARDDELDGLRACVDDAAAQLAILIEQTNAIGACSALQLDAFASWGERLSSEFVACALRQRGIPAEACDARALVLTNGHHGNARVDQLATYPVIVEHFAQREKLQVVTGFIGRSHDGATTTLGRGGSDLTASLFGAALGAERIEIWTDVDGVLSADPRRVPSAFTIDELSYEEMMELSHFGAKVVYPPTVWPARQAGIPLVIRNTFRPEFPGTWVVEAGLASATASPFLATGITSICRVALLRLEGRGLIGVPGTARRLFGTLAHVGVNVILISQASSEHSICLAVDPESAALARQCTDAEFAEEIADGAVKPLVVEDDLCVIAVVGERMREHPGIAALLFSALGRAGINVRAIAQGSSELNISAVLRSEDETLALRVVHRAFFEADRALPVALAGVGGVARALLEQLAAAPAFGAGGHTPTLLLVGLSDSSRNLWQLDGLDLAALAGPGHAKNVLVESGREGDFFSDLLRLPAGVFVDCTANEQVAYRYAELLQNGWTVVTANKVGLCFPAAAGATNSEGAEARSLAKQERPGFEPLRAAWRSHPRHLFAEATVGAGLPVISTLDSLLQTGDSVRLIEGVFSGTLAYVFGELATGRSLREAVEDAQRLGYTEPDPRIDLSGLDVARKLLILARAAGQRLELEDIEVEPVIGKPPREQGAGADGHPDGDRGHQLGTELDRVGALLAERLAAAADNGCRLVYLASWAPGRATVGLQEVASDHPAANLRGTDNLFVFRTSRYADQPLVVRGPGAGPAVTAAAVHADILSAAALLRREGRCGRIDP